MAVIPGGVNDEPLNCIHMNEKLPKKGEKAFWPPYMIEKIKNTVQRIKDFLSEAGPEMSVTGQQLIAGILGLCLLASALLYIMLALPAFILAAISVLWYVFTGQASPETAPKASIWSKVNIFLAMAVVGMIPYCLLVGWLGFSGSMILVAFVGVLVMVVVTAVLLHSDRGKAAWTTLTEAGTKLAKKDEPVYKPGDVVLCVDKDRQEAGDKDPREILPYKDRFLHMLIIGPTGGGKTSQVILPMINQDIQNLEAGVTVIEPKGDLAREVAMMAKVANRPYIYFDPSVDNCPFFNPLVGEEDDVIENAVTTFLMLNPDSPQYFKDLSEQIVRYTLKVLKRMDREEGVDGKYATFVNMNTILQNPGQQGRAMVNRFASLQKGTDAERKENADIASWFINEYYAERSKVYENSSGIRAQVSKIIANRYLRRVLNPDFEKNERNEIDFDKNLADGGVICICTAQGKMRDLGKFLGYFIILQLQSAVFRRPGNEDNRRGHFLYIDEFQTYSTPGFSDMLTQGRSYRVASHLATQARAQIAMGGGRDGKNFVELVSANARNLIIFPGISFSDAKFYSDQFGEHETTEVVKSESRKKFNLVTGGLDRLGHPTESIREQKKVEALFSPTAIMKRPFGELTYAIIKNNSVQPAKVGVVQWLPKEYDRMLKDMIETEIVPHEFKTLHDVEEGRAPADSFTFDPVTDAEPVPATPARPAPKPNLTSELGLGEEPVDEGMEPPPGSNIPPDILFADPHPGASDDDDFFTKGATGPDPQDEFNKRFDDLTRDPLIDDDDLI